MYHLYFVSGNDGGAIPDDANRVTNSVARNAEYKEATYLEFANKRIRTADLKRAMAAAQPPTQPPKYSNGQQICISYHVKGVCNQRCQHAGHSHRVHTEAEDNLLVGWCREHYHL